MKRQAELQRRVATLGALREAMSAMKSLSAHHFREARRAVDSARTYRAGIERIALQVGATLAAGDGPAGLLVIGAELGLCGGYNARLVEAGARRREELGPGPTLCVGRRATALLARRGLDLQASYAGPGSVRGIPSLLLELAEELLATYAAQRLSSFEIVSSRFAGVGVVSPSPFRLLPPPPRPADTQLRTPYAPPEELASAALRELLYISLYDLLLDALASEHAARLAATQAAETWLDERRERLRRQLAATRREANTQEVLEIAAGTQPHKRSSSLKPGDAA